MRLVNNISSRQTGQRRGPKGASANEVQNMRIIQKIVLNPLMAATKQQQQQKQQYQDLQ